MTDKFKKDSTGNYILFTGDRLEAMIPERYDTHGCLKVDEQISTLGVFDLNIDGSDVGLFIPAIVTMAPSEVERIQDPNGDAYYKIIFYKNDTFMNTKVVQDANIAFVCFHELVFLGRMIESITYDDFPKLFSIMSDICDINLGVDRVMFEIVASYIYRYADNQNLQARHGDMKSRLVIVPLSNVSVLTETTTSRLLGSNFDDTLNAAIVNPATQSTEYEDVLRQ